MGPNKAVSYLRWFFSYPANGCPSRRSSGCLAQGYLAAALRTPVLHAKPTHAAMTTVPLTAAEMIAMMPTGMAVEEDSETTTTVSGPSCHATGRPRCVNVSMSSSILNLDSRHFAFAATSVFKNTFFRHSEQSAKSGRVQWVTGSADCMMVRGKVGSGWVLLVQQSGGVSCVGVQSVDEGRRVLERFVAKWNKGVGGCASLGEITVNSQTYTGTLPFWTSVNVVERFCSRVCNADFGVSHQHAMVWNARLGTGVKVTVMYFPTSGNYNLLGPKSQAVADEVAHEFEEQMQQAVVACGEAFRTPDEALALMGKRRRVRGQQTALGHRAARGCGGGVRKTVVTKKQKMKTTKKQQEQEQEEQPVIEKKRKSLPPQLKVVDNGAMTATTQAFYQEEVPALGACVLVESLQGPSVLRSSPLACVVDEMTEEIACVAMEASDESPAASDGAGVEKTEAKEEEWAWWHELEERDAGNGGAGVVELCVSWGSPTAMMEA